MYKALTRSNVEFKRYQEQGLLGGPITTYDRVTSFQVNDDTVHATIAAFKSEEDSVKHSNSLSDVNFNVPPTEYPAEIQEMFKKIQEAILIRAKEMAIAKTWPEGEKEGFDTAVEVAEIAIK